MTLPESVTTRSMPPEELRAAMRSLGHWSHSELADSIGVSRSSVSLWLAGRVGVPRPCAMLIRMLLAAQRRQIDTGNIFTGQPLRKWVGYDRREAMGLVK
jgi:transcriptional regulator with XRE-family HTH domain